MISAPGPLGSRSALIGAGSPEPQGASSRMIIRYFIRFLLCDHSNRLPAEVHGRQIMTDLCQVVTFKRQFQIPRPLSAFCDHFVTRGQKWVRREVECGVA